MVGTKANLLRMDQSYLCPTNSSLTEYKEIFFAFILCDLPEFRPVYSCEKRVSFYFLHPIYS